MAQLCWYERTVYLNRINNGYGEYVSGDSNISLGRSAAILADGSRIAIQNYAANRAKTLECGTKRDENGNNILDEDGNPIPAYCTYGNFAFIYVDTNGAK